jgi:hypothetical protein
MSLYKIDRIQYLENEGPDAAEEFYIYEFAELDCLSLQSCIAEFKKRPGRYGADEIIRKYLSPALSAKLAFLYSLMEHHHYTLFIILYDQNHNEFCLIGTGFEKIYILSFKKLQQWFLKYNAKGFSTGKLLGKAQPAEDNHSDFVNTVLNDIGQPVDGHDDCGLKLTQKLLAGTGTKGFDLDLFQYIENTGEYIIFEFLRRMNPYVSNYTAHPMRYSWTGSNSDNQKKFISLWKAKQKFNARLYLVNYSDSSGEEGIGLTEVVGMNDRTGFTGERK